AVENPKQLANLRSGNLHHWARCYFANRLQLLGKENGVRVIGVSPYQTSVTCSKCGCVDKESRSSRLFQCTACGFTAHADYNAAINIERKGTESIRNGRFLTAKEANLDNAIRRGGA